MAEETRKRLGRGLAALLGDAADPPPMERSRGQRKIPIEFLRPNPRNPRQSFHDEDLAELAASIREKGVIQPIVVRGVAGRADAYEIIAGERRWRAAQLASLAEVPIVIHDADDKEALEIAIVENVQRADLNAIEEAHGYQRLNEEFGHSQGEIARIIGKSRPHVANTLRLLGLPASAKKLVADGAISAGHARALLGAADPAALARRIVEQGLTVRDAERLSKEPKKESGDTNPRRPALTQDPDTCALEKSVADLLGMTVQIRRHGDRGEVRVRYETLDQLDAICRLLSS